MHSTNRYDIVILGGGYAGMMAAARSAPLARGQKVVLVDAQAQFLQRIRLHEQAAGETIRAFAYQRVLARRRIGFIKARATAIDALRSTVTLKAEDGSQQQICYGKLVYALGSVMNNNAIPGQREHAWNVAGLAQAQAVFVRVDQLARQGRPKVAVIGGGLTGTELVMELAERFPTVEWIWLPGNGLGAGFCANAKAHVEAVAAGLGVRSIPHARVESIAADSLMLRDGSTLTVDGVITAAGFRANPLAALSGLPVDELERVTVDERLRVHGCDNIWAAGDAASVRQENGRLIRMSCAAAMPMGVYVGDSLTRLAQGRSPDAFKFGYFFKCVSLGRREGIIQFVDALDQPQPRVWTGTSAVRTKEWVCRMTYYMPLAELSSGLRLYQWPQTASTLSSEVGLSETGGRSGVSAEAHA